MYFNVNYLSSLFKSICYVTSTASATECRTVAIFSGAGRPERAVFESWAEAVLLFACASFIRFRRHHSVLTSSYLIEGKIHRDGSWQPRCRAPPGERLNTFWTNTFFFLSYLYAKSQSISFASMPFWATNFVAPFTSFQFQVIESQWRRVCTATQYPQSNNVGSDSESISFWLRLCFEENIKKN